MYNFHGTYPGQSCALVADLGKLCRASGVGATVRASDVPIAQALSSAFDDEEALLCALGCRIGDKGALVRYSK